MFARGNLLTPLLLKKNYVVGSYLGNFILPTQTFPTYVGITPWGPLLGCCIFELIFLRHTVQMTEAEGHLLAEIARVGVGLMTTRVTV